MRACGTLMPFEREAGEALLACLRRIRAKAPRELAAAAREFGIEADAKALAGMLTPDLLLAHLPSCSRTPGSPRR